MLCASCSARCFVGETQGILLGSKWTTPKHVDKYRNYGSLACSLWWKLSQVVLAWKSMEILNVNWIQRMFPSKKWLTLFVVQPFWKLGHPKPLTKHQVSSLSAGQQGEVDSWLAENPWGFWRWLRVCTMGLPTPLNISPGVFSQSMRKAQVEGGSIWRRKINRLISRSFLLQHISFDARPLQAPRLCLCQLQLWTGELGVEWAATQLGAWNHGQDPNKNTNDSGWINWASY